MKALSCVLVVLLRLSSVENKALELHHGVMVHLFEWKYRDIALECERFLAHHGITTVQISPPTENLVVGGQWWERYQVVSYQLISRSGDEKQLSDMLIRCNRMGVRVVADVVFNHMTGSVADCRGVGGTTCNPQNLSYPGVPYTADDFHHPECYLNNFDNATEVRVCNLLGLHDLDQSQDSVREKIVEFMNHLVDLGIAGFRIDAAKHMYPDDLSAIFQKVKDLNTAHGFPEGTKPFIFQEVSNFGIVTYEEYAPLGLVTDFTYGEELGRCFQGWNDLKWLRNFGTHWNLLPGNVSVVFVNNHDTERCTNKNILNYKIPKSYKMAMVFKLTFGLGTPKLLSSYQYSSFDQGPPSHSPHPIHGNYCSDGWLCQHRWRQVINSVKFHNVVKGTKVKSWWDNDKNQIAYCRGNKGFVAFNLENYDLNQTLQTCLPQGNYCDIISGEVTSGKCSGKVMQVAKDGKAQIFISRFDPESPDDGVLAIHIKSKVTLAA